MANIQEGRRTADRRAAVQGLIADVGRTFKELRCVGSQRLVKLGISMQHLQALTMLQHHGPQTMTRLADMLDVSLSNATGIVDRLEDRGFVERVRVKDDRRIVLVQPTPAADGVMEHLDVLRSAMLEEALARLDDDRLEVVEAGLRAFRDALQMELDVHPERYSHGPVSPNPDHVGTIPPTRPRRARPLCPRPRPSEEGPFMEAFPAEGGGQSPSLADDPALGLDRRAKLEILGAILLALFLGALDQTIVGTALPKIVTDLGGNEPLHVGRHDLPADIHRQRAVLRQALRPLRPEAAADDRHHPVPHRLGPLRPEPDDVSN